MDYHQDVAPFAFLIGTWRGEGRGFYPTISDFRYQETVTFSALPGKPFLRYEQRTQNLDSGAPMHTELGFLRPQSDGGVELVLAQPTGQTELLHGIAELFDDRATLTFDESTVSNSRTSKPVVSTSRTYTRVGNSLTTAFNMAAAGQPLQQHLASVLTKDD
ncbi:hypothetical protein CATRI_05870 [Corynebacterium atrinae]|uniref:FABP family protein n=1 Tax=Corynebacterium atrinae TaxID=1336740 RepID=UPI0025B56964|nr:FABP family protein [Corynebacterium atrinae]WJY63262.1 hypothetical protein CATRI_05870 [Corynebacterium atrinae]